MLEHAAPPTHGRDRRRKTTAVVPLHAAHLHGRPAVPVAAPPLARRMRDDRMRPRVRARVALFIPRVDIVETRIHAGRLDEERRDHKRAIKRISSSREARIITSR
jgi:hypothetical protein